jgi:hypothetical protein
MCPNTPPALVTGEPKVERLADVFRTDQKLAACRTVGELRDKLRAQKKTDVGAVLLGGNAVSSNHDLKHKEGMLCALSASYVAKCSFNGSKGNATWADIIMLPHTATIADLKREFYRINRGPIDAALGQNGAATTARDSSIDSVIDCMVCRDQDGRVLAASARLPSTSQTACADVGYHSAFFLDVKPQSMKKSYVQHKVDVSSSAISAFISAGNDLGAGTYTATNYPECYTSVRGELRARQQASTRTEPALLSAGPLEETRASFQALEDEKECRSNLPLIFRRYAQELIEDIGGRKMDAVNPDAVDAMKQHIDQLRPFVQELVRLQKPNSWISYDGTVTEHEQELSLAQVVEAVEEAQGTLQLHEQIHLLQVQMSSLAMDQNKGECEEFAACFQALIAEFDRAHQQHISLSVRLEDLEQTCRRSVREAEQTDAGLRKTLEDERSNTARLTALKEEGNCMHAMVCEQIKWSQDFVANSSSETQGRIESLDREIQRLQALREQEARRLASLGSCADYLANLEEQERGLHQAFASDNEAALQIATSRVLRASKAVASSAQFMGQLASLQQQAKDEMQDALGYLNVLLKQLGVDCHTAYLSTGKFLAIQGQVVDKNCGRFQNEYDAKARASLEANVEKDEDLPDTVERAQQAQMELDRADAALKKCFEKRAKNKDQRDTLKRDIEPVLDWLAGGKSRNKSNRVLLVRDKEAFEGVADVNDFRAFRECEGQEGTSHTLERLEDFEASFERRFKGESDSNLAALADNMRRSMMDLGMRMIGR